MPAHQDDVAANPRTGATTVGVPASTPPPRADRFAPGAIVAGRYRLVALLGRGGMGEVYRAEDLTLDQPVALKFLPAGVAANDARLAQFHNELRLARQVSHKNVCRLYDLGEADGRRFLTMEYVDGEDLSTSLRRFGRMPPDKAVQIARQLCAGVAAAHEKGVLHRDLKPANVMLDGNGDVRITDFGIATAAADVGGPIAGTPQYMAPELLAGQPATAKSDIYALGLILFEIFTGRRAYDAKTIPELRQLQQTQTITTPSSIVRDLDPAIERIVLRCLEKDPERRPASALTVAAALPGGDPLAAALSAGETPSPEMLVAAGESEAMAVAPALGLAAAFVGSLLVAVAIVTRGSVVGLIPMNLPLDVLTDRAVQTIRSVGYQVEGADRAIGFSFAQDFLIWERENGPVAWWNPLRTGWPAAVYFWLRTSPREFIPVAVAGRVSPVDPPMNVSGMQQIFIDTEGRLVEFHSVPAQVSAGPATADVPNWRPLFDAAGFDLDAFTPTLPEWTPRDFADRRAAWLGSLPGRPDLRIRVEAAAFRGRPVSFQIIWPWTRPTRMVPPARTLLQQVANTVNVGIWLAVLTGAMLFARQNVRAGRADHRGAARLAIGLAIINFGGQLLSAKHSTTPAIERGQLIGALYLACGIGAVVWVLYLAIEPYARRFWPDALLGWTRVLSGRVRDPRVGRELLIGLTIGAASLLAELVRLLPSAFGRRITMLPFGNTLSPLLGTPLLVSRWVDWLVNALESTLAVAMVFIVLRLLLKRPWLVVPAGIAVLAAVSENGLAISGNWMDTLSILLTVSLITLVIYRFGLLALAAAAFVSNLVDSPPLTLNLSAWWATPTTLTLALMIGLVSFACVAARAGQPLLGSVLRD